MSLKLTNKTFKRDIDYSYEPHRELGKLLRQVVDKPETGNKRTHLDTVLGPSTHPLGLPLVRYLTIRTNTWNLNLSIRYYINE